MDDRVSRIGRHKARDTRIEKEGKEDSDVKSHIHSDDNKTHEQNRKNKDSERRHEIALDAECREDQRVFEYLSELHVKCDEHEVDIEAHEDIHQGDRNNCGVQEACKSVCGL